MKNKDSEIFDDDLAIEDILKPRAKFHVSPGFKQRVMEEAKAMQINRRRRRWIPLTISSAAAIATLVVLTAIHFHSSESPAEKQPITVSTEIPAFTPGDSLNKEAKTPLIAEAFPAKLIKEKTNSPKQSNRKNPARRNTSSKADTGKPSALESKLEPVIEGELPKINREGMLDPNQVRTHILKTRRNAEIAYIEQIRDEIEANQAYIAQLMAEVNVNQ